MPDVPLYNRAGDVVGRAVVSPEDAGALQSLRWHVDGEGYPARYHQRMHSLVAARMGIAGEKRDVDHRNGDKLDNRRENLRPATRRQNATNPNNRLRSDNRSGVKGVWWDADRQRWSAQGVTRAGRRVSLGRYRTIDEATRVRAEFVAEHYA